MNQSNRSIIIPIALTVITVIVIVFTTIIVLRSKDDRPADKEPVTSRQSQPDKKPEPQLELSNRVRMTVEDSAGGSWHYTIDSQAKDKFSIEVRGSLRRVGEVLVISAVGCNEMSAAVTDIDPGGEGRTLTTDGKTYYLDGPVQTLMACLGEKADWDQQATDEIYQIFESLKRS